jgi:hypothetical protein
MILSIFFGAIFLIQGVYGLVQLINLSKKQKESKKSVAKKTQENVKENNDKTEENKG